jgi:hypothetical protein
VNTSSCRSAAKEKENSIKTEIIRRIGLLLILICSREKAG